MGRLLIERHQLCPRFVMGSSIRNPIHKTCLAVMYACGLRISEASTLEVDAIDRANRVLRIVGQGNNWRLAPLPVLDELGQLWRIHRNRRWLFPNHRGDAPINKRLLARSFAAAAAAAGIQRGVSPWSSVASGCGPDRTSWSEPSNRASCR
jgi:site-specific recombinase XerD